MSYVPLNARNGHENVKMCKFSLKFDKCISHESTITNHSYLDHWYPMMFALFPLVRTPVSMPGDGAKGQNLGHL